MCIVAASSQCIYRRTAIHSVPPSSSEDPDILRYSVHLEEDFGEGGLKVEPLACVRRSVCGMLYADDAGIVSKSTENLAKMSIIVTVFESEDLTVPETETETMLLRTLNKVLPTPPPVVEAAGHIYIYADDAFSVPGHGLINASAKIMPWMNDGFDSRGHSTIVSSGTCYDRFKRELYGMEDASFTLKLRLLRTEVMKTLLYGHVARNLGQGHFADLRTVH